MARVAPSELSTIPAVRRRDKRVVAQWFTVDIAAVEYTQTRPAGRWGAAANCPQASSTKPKIACFRRRAADRESQ